MNSLFHARKRLFNFSNDFLCCGLMCADRAVLLLAGQRGACVRVCVCKAWYMRRRLCFLGSTTCALD